MGEKEWSSTGIFDLFGDDLSRRILVLASERPLSANQLASTLDTSNPTVYRRLNELLEYDLLREHQEIDADGNHYKTYETTLDRITFEIEDGGYNVDIQLRRSLVDQFDGLWSSFGEAGVDESAGRDERTDTPTTHSPHG